MSSAKYGGAWPDKDEKTKYAILRSVNTSLDRKPAQLPQNRRDMIASSDSSEKPSSGVLDGLNSPDKIVGHTIEQ